MPENHRDMAALMDREAGACRCRDCGIVRGAGRLIREARSNVATAASSLANLYVEDD